MPHKLIRIVYALDGPKHVQTLSLPLNGPNPKGRDLFFLFFSLFFFFFRGGGAFLGWVVGDWEKPASFCRSLHISRHTQKAIRSNPGTPKVSFATEAQHATPPRGVGGLGKPE